METRLIALELVLRELDMDTTITTLDDRIRLQKAIYLSQKAGVPLGYRFSWYVRGPYSTRLTNDYYSLQTATDVEREAVEGKQLRNDFRDSLGIISPMMRPPSDFNRSSADWLELLSSLHYLEEQHPGDSRSKLQDLKPHLYQYADIAERKLIDVGLLST